jgi:hypothetical protein
MRGVLLGVAAAVAILAAARAAELPTIKHARPEHYKTCTVGGMTGVLIPGSGLCVKVSGYVSGGVEIGSRR